MASVAAAIPLINRVLVGGMAKVPKSLLIAAQVQGAGFGRRMRTVLLPLLHGSVVSAVLAAFGGSVFNLAITTILYPPNYSTLPVYISDSYNDLKFGYAAAATIVGAAFIIGIMLILEYLMNLSRSGTNRPACAVRSPRRNRAAETGCGDRFAGDSQTRP